jgi:hypothetical protein
MIFAIDDRAAIELAATPISKSKFVAATQSSRLGGVPES